MKTLKVSSLVRVVVILMILGFMFPGNLFAPQFGQKPPLTVNNFRVEIDGIVMANFHSVEGLESMISVIGYRDGTSRSTLKIPGTSECSNLILRFDLRKGQELWEWYKKGVTGNAETKNMSIILFDAAQTDIARYDFEDVWPCAWRGPELNASGNEPALAELEVVIGSMNLYLPNM